ncbi:hypothetical protein CDL12_27756 [Handroanthus impetiginosus]|uniref:Uncharacterized protein n=1 Tax=Handroanthus impetiginosus TaxID=429701 RepID=A0A2G9G3M7_9LAMI|nr:hypothetical protein CDL12_27756 [Handroanthus impetiginosus]
MASKLRRLYDPFINPLTIKSLTTQHLGIILFSKLYMSTVGRLAIAFASQFISFTQNSITDIIFFSDKLMHIGWIENAI